MSESQPGNISFELSHDPWGRLTLTDAAGETHVDVEPIRAFPLSEPNRFISICNAAGREIVAIDDLATLPDDLRRMLTKELDRREFLPVIVKIHHVTLDAEPTEWTVDTDRGPTKFLVDGSDAVRPIGHNRFLINDMQGVRYLVNDARKLDAHSRKLLEHYF
jgi:hypothetical protein